MSVTDLAYLQAVYARINVREPERLRVKCPDCHHEFHVEVERGHGGAFRHDTTQP